VCVGKVRCLHCGIGVTLSATYLAWVSGLRPEDQAEALAAPAAIGMAAESDVWETLIDLEPDRSLPLLVSPDCEDAPSAAVVETFLRAHRLGGFYHLVVERLCDPAGVEVPALRDVSRLLRQGWIDALSDATGQPALAQETVARALRRWRLGVGLERWYLAHGQLEPSYARVSRLKNGWVSASTCAMLARHGRPGQAQALSRAYDCFLLGMQCRDDVQDADDGRFRRGASIPEALGLSPGVLLRTAPFLVHRAAAHARRGRLETLAAWFDDFADRLLVIDRPGDALRDGLLAMIATARMDQAMAAVDDAASSN
jgi:hypothetical protein